MISSALEDCVCGERVSPHCNPKAALPSVSTLWAGCLVIVTGTNMPTPACAITWAITLLGPPHVLSSVTHHKATELTLKHLKMMWAAMVAGPYHTQSSSENMLWKKLSLIFFIFSLILRALNILERLFKIQTIVQMIFTVLFFSHNIIFLSHWSMLVNIILTSEYYVIIWRYLILITSQFLNLLIKTLAKICIHLSDHCLIVFLRCGVSLYIDKNLLNPVDAYCQTAF